MSMNEMDEAHVRQRVEQRYKQRQILIIHVTVFVLVNLMLWATWAFLMPVSIVKMIGDTVVSEISTGGFPWPIIITLGWGIGLLAHFLTYYNQYGGGAARREEAIEREIQRYYEHSAAYEKPKHDQNIRLELTEDGEIEEIYEDEPSRTRKRE